MQTEPKNIVIIETPYGKAFFMAELLAVASGILTIKSGWISGGIYFLFKAELVGNQKPGDTPRFVNGEVGQGYYNDHHRRITFDFSRRKEKISGLLSWCRRNIQTLATRKLLDGAIIMNCRNNIANLQRALSDVTEDYNNQIHIQEEEIRGLLARSFPDRV